MRGAGMGISLFKNGDHGTAGVNALPPLLCNRTICFGLGTVC